MMLPKINEDGTHEPYPRAATRLQGKAAYEADVARRPLYPSGKPRAQWEHLSELVRSSWFD